MNPIIFPIGGLAALVAWALSEDEASASETRPTRDDTASANVLKSAAEIKKSIPTPKKPIPVFKQVASAPGEPAKFEHVANTTASNPAILQSSKPVSFKEWEKDKKRKQKENNCQPGFEPAFDAYNKTWAEYHCQPSNAVNNPSDASKILADKQAAKDAADEVKAAKEARDDAKKAADKIANDEIKAAKKARDEAKKAADKQKKEADKAAKEAAKIAAGVSRSDWEKDKKKKQKSNNCQPGFSPVFQDYNKSWAEYNCQPDNAVVNPSEVSKILQAKDNEKKQSDDVKKVADKKGKQKKVSLADWQADMKKKKLDNNCQDGTSPQFDQYSGNWAEYHCQPVGSQKTASLPKVESASFEPGAKAQVEAALASNSRSFIQNTADNIRGQYPLAAGYLDNKALTTKFGPNVPVNEFHPKSNELVFEPDVVTMPSHSNDMTFEPDVITLHKPSEATKVVMKKDAEKKASDSNQSSNRVSKKDWENDKKRKLASNNCSEGMEPKFKPFNNSWADYQCGYTSDISQSIATLKTAGIEDDIAPKIALFLSKRPSSSSARDYANQLAHSKPKAADRLNTYASFEEYKNSGKSTNPKDIAIAASKSSNPKDLIDHAKALEATGNPKAAETVKAKASSEAAKKGFKILDDKEADKLVKEAKNTTDLSRLTEISTVLRTGKFNAKADIVDRRMGDLLSPDKAQSMTFEPDVITLQKPSKVSSTSYPSTISDSQKSSTQKKSTSSSSTASSASAPSPSKASPSHFDTSTNDPTGGLDDLEDKIEAKEKAARTKAKGQVSGEGNASSHSTTPQRVGVSSPIPGVPNDRWISFIKVMKSGKPNSITPSYALGMFGFGMRRLADYGLVKNVRQTAYHGNTVWDGDWVSPMDLKAFLSDAGYQYELLENDLANKAEYIVENGAVGKQIDGSPATLSGLLAVAFKTTEKSFNHFLNAPKAERDKFQSTMDLYERANGIF